MKFKRNHFHSFISVKEITLKNDMKYTVRNERNRYFFPDEWMVFFDVLKKSQKVTFQFLINTGARINEIRNVKVGDVDFDRGSIIIRQTKSRNKDGTKKMRVIPVSTQFIKYLKKIVNKNKLQQEDYFPVLSTPAANIAMKVGLKKAGIPDWQMFSVHNVRKSLETWLMALNVDMMKVVKHFGHSFAVAGKFYVSSDVFNYEDKKNMRDIIGDLYST